MVHNKLVKSFSDIKTQRVAAYTPGRFPLSKADGWESPIPPGWDTSPSQVNSRRKPFPNFSWVDWANVEKVPCVSHNTQHQGTTTGLEPAIVGFNTFALWDLFSYITLMLLVRIAENQMPALQLTLIPL